MNQRSGVGWSGTASFVCNLRTGTLYGLLALANKKPASMRRVFHTMKSSYARARAVIQQRSPLREPRRLPLREPLQQP